METSRHNFKKDDTKAKIDFIAQMFDIINQSCGGDKDLYDIVEHYADNRKGNSFLTLKRILSNIFINTDIRDINLIDQQLSKGKIDIEHSDQLGGIVKEFQQIEEQTRQMMGSSIKIATDVDIVKTDENDQSSHIDSIDLVEMVDLGEDMDNDGSLVTDSDLKEETNLVCIFCENGKILVISSTEGYCPDCDKNFLIQNRGDSKKSVLEEN